jgi:hypothetical protein
MEPIDSLQTLFDAWLETVVGVEENRLRGGFVVYPNPASSYLVVGQLDNWTVGQDQVGGKDIVIRINNLVGKMMGEFYLHRNETGTIRINLSDYQPGIYFVTIFNGNILIKSEKLVIIH